MRPTIQGSHSAVSPFVRAFHSLTTSSVDSFSRTGVKPRLLKAAWMCSPLCEMCVLRASLQHTAQICTVSFSSSKLSENLLRNGGKAKNDLGSKGGTTSFVRGGTSSLNSATGSLLGLFRQLHTLPFFLESCPSIMLEPEHFLSRWQRNQFLLWLNTSKDTLCQERWGFRCNPFVVTLDARHCYEENTSACATLRNLWQLQNTCRRHQPEVQFS